MSLYATPVSVLIVYTLSKILALRSRHVHPTTAVTFDSHRRIMILHNPEDYCTFTRCTVGGFKTANLCSEQINVFLRFLSLYGYFYFLSTEMSPFDFCVIN